MVNTVSLKKNNCFKNVYNNGSSAASRYLVMIVLPNSQNINRLGITVSKKVGKSVVRSRVTRLIREAYRLNESILRTGFDIVIIARVNAAGTKFSEIERSFIHLTGKTGVRKQA